MQRTAHLRTSGTSYRSRGEISCGQCHRVFDSAASCLMHQQMHLQSHTCPSGLCALHVFMHLPAQLHSHGLLQVEQQQQACRVIMLSLPQTLPGRMHVPYLAGGGAHLSYQFSQLSHLSQALSQSINLCIPWLLCSDLCPQLHQRSICIPHCLLVSPVHPTAHMETRHGHCKSSLARQRGHAPLWGTKGVNTDSQMTPASCPPAGQPEAHQLPAACVSTRSGSMLPTPGRRIGPVASMRRQTAQHAVAAPPRPAAAGVQTPKQLGYTMPGQHFAAHVGLLPRFVGLQHLPCLTRRLAQLARLSPVSLLSWHKALPLELLCTGSECAASRSISRELVDLRSHHHLKGSSVQVHPGGLAC